MKVLLIDYDSKIPNLALMKISAYEKSLGNEVGFNINDPDKIYASIVFDKNRKKLSGLKKFYPEAEVILGGSGYDLSIKLKDEIEYLKPDYDLYPNNQHSIGFTTRGCIRNCYFCIVPQKEGRLVRWQHPKEFHDERYKKIMILDNNWLADREWFFETSQWIIDKKLKLREGGLDIRLMTDEIAEQLSKFKLDRPLHFAFDDMKSKDKTLRGIEILKNHKINTHHSTTFYIYCNDDSQYEDTLERVKILKNIDVNAFVMINQNTKITRRMRQLQRWVNIPMLFWKIDISEYDRKKYG
jgi:hypothetical protein